MQLLNYAATYPEAINRYHAIRMTLHMNSDTSFLPAPGDKRISGGYHYLSETSKNPENPPHKTPPLNGPIHVECTTMKNVLENAMELDEGSLFVNCKQGTELIIPLEERGHQQPLTPLVTNSATINGFVNDNIRQMFLEQLT